MEDELTYSCIVKPFDIDLDWMGKFQNVQKATFWSADSDEGKQTTAQTVSPLLDLSLLNSHARAFRDVTHST